MSAIEEMVRGLVREEIALASAAIPKPGPEPQQYFTAEEAAGYTRRSVGTLTNAVSEGRLRRCGKKRCKLLFKREDLDAYMSGGSIVAPGKIGAST